MATELANPQIDRLALNAQGQVFEVSKSIGFEAAHRLPSRGVDEAYGRMHGHSFELEATVAGKVKPGELWVEDIALLTAALEGIAKALDHQLLNEVEGLETPTLETILVWVAQRLSGELKGLSRVKLSRPSLKEVCTLHMSSDARGT